MVDGVRFVSRVFAFVLLASAAALALGVLPGIFWAWSRKGRGFACGRPHWIFLAYYIGTIAWVCGVLLLHPSLHGPGISRALALVAVNAGGPAAVMMVGMWTLTRRGKVQVLGCALDAEEDQAKGEVDSCRYRFASGACLAAICAINLVCCFAGLL